MSKEQQEIEYEVPGKSLVHRSGSTIYFFDEVDSASVCEAIRYLDAIERDKKITELSIVFSSNGGSIYDGLALYDRIRASRCRVTTIGTGLVASMAFVVFLAGDRRVCTKNVRFLNHQASAELRGKLTDLDIEHVETKMLEDICIQIISERTNQTAKRLKKDTKVGDKYIYADEAFKTLIVHEIIEEVKKEQG